MGTERPTNPSGKAIDEKWMRALYLEAPASVGLPSGMGARTKGMAGRGSRMIGLDVHGYHHELTNENRRLFDAWMVRVGFEGQPITGIWIADESGSMLKVTQYSEPLRLDEARLHPVTETRMVQVSEPFPVHLLSRSDVTPWRRFVLTPKETRREH